MTFSTLYSAGIATLALIIACAAWLFPRQAPGKIILRVKEQPRIGAPNIYTITNHGTKEASIQSIDLIFTSNDGQKHSISCGATAGAEMARGLGGLPNISRPIANGDFIEVSIDAGKDPIKNVLKKACYAQQQGKWSLEVKTRQELTPRNFPVSAPSVKAEA